MCDMDFMRQAWNISMETFRDSLNDFSWTQA